MFHFLFKQLVRGTRKPIRSSAGRSPAARHRGFRPSLESLEDRTVLSPVATHFQVVTPSSDHVNQPAEVEVVALDAANHPVANYTGTVKLTSTGGKPITYRFTPHDQGNHTFTVTPKTVHTMTISATDPAHKVTGKATLDVTPAAATHFLVVIDGGGDGSGSESEDGASATTASGSGSAQAIVGTAVRVEVIALDANNNVVPGYTGTVQLSSTDTATTFTNGDGSALTGASYTFTAADAGEHTFLLTSGAVGSETVTVADSANSLTSSTTLNVVAAPVATQIHVEVSGDSVQSGQPVAIEVKVLDASGQVVPNYTGTIQLTSSDTGATFTNADGTALTGGSYTFTAADAGEHVFFVTFTANGSPTLTLTDSANNLTATVTVNVGASSSSGDSTDGTSCAGDGGNNGTNASTGGTTQTGNPAARHTGPQHGAAAIKPSSGVHG